MTVSRDSSVAASQPAATDRRLCARPSRIQRGARGYLGRRGCHGVQATHIFVSVSSSPFEPHERRAQLDGTANGAPRLRRVRQHPGRHPPLRANASATVVMGHQGPRGASLDCGGGLGGQPRGAGLDCGGGQGGQPRGAGLDCGGGLDDPTRSAAVSLATRALSATPPRVEMGTSVCKDISTSTRLANGAF